MAVRQASMAVKPPPMTVTLLPDVDLAVALEVAEEVDGRDDPGSVLAGAAHGVGAEGAQGEEDGVVLGAQVVQLDVDAEAHAGLQLDAHAPEDVELVVDDVARQAVAGDAVAEHAPGMRHGLEDRDGVPFEARVEGGGEAGGPAADDRDALAGSRAWARAEAAARPPARRGACGRPCSGAAGRW